MTSANPNAVRLGFIGLGAVGAPMARNALAAGWPVALCDENAKACERLLAEGATWADSPRALSTRADIIQIAVATAEQLREVALNEERGMLAGARPGQSWIIHSTVGPEICLELAERAAVVGVTIIDAPVTGPGSAPQSAAEHDVTYLIGAETSALESVRPALELSGKNLFHIGDVGAGQSAKLAANALAIVQMQATYETIGMLRELGMSDEDTIAMLKVSSAANWAVDHWSMVAIAGKAPASQREIPVKDLAYAAAAAEKLGVQLDLADHVKDTLVRPGLGFLAGTRRDLA